MENKKFEKELANYWFSKMNDGFYFFVPRRLLVDAIELEEEEDMYYREGMIYDCD